MVRYFNRKEPSKDDERQTKISAFFENQPNREESKLFTKISSVLPRNTRKLTLDKKLKTEPLDKHVLSRQEGRHLAERAVKDYKRDAVDAFSDNDVVYIGGEDPELVSKYTENFKSKEASEAPKQLVDGKNNLVRTKEFGSIGRQTERNEKSGISLDTKREIMKDNKFTVPASEEVVLDRDGESNYPGSLDAQQNTSVVPNENLQCGFIGSTASSHHQSQSVLSAGRCGDGMTTLYSFVTPKKLLNKDTDDHTIVEGSPDIICETPELDYVLKDSKARKKFGSCRSFLCREDRLGVQPGLKSAHLRGNYEEVPRKCLGKVSVNFRSKGRTLGNPVTKLRDEKTVSVSANYEPVLVDDSNQQIGTGTCTTNSNKSTRNLCIRVEDSTESDCLKEGNAQQQQVLADEIFEQRRPEIRVRAASVCIIPETQQFMDPTEMKEKETAEHILEIDQVINEDESDLQPLSIVQPSPSQRAKSWSQLDIDAEKEHKVGIDSDSFNDSSFRHIRHISDESTSDVDMKTWDSKIHLLSNVKDGDLNKLGESDRFFPRTMSNAKQLPTSCSFGRTKSRSKLISALEEADSRAEEAEENSWMGERLMKHFAEDDIILSCTDRGDRNNTDTTPVKIYGGSRMTTKRQAKPGMSPLSKRRPQNLCTERKYDLSKEGIDCIPERSVSKAKKTCLENELEPFQSKTKFTKQRAYQFGLKNKEKSASDEMKVTLADDKFLVDLLGQLSSPISKLDNKPARKSVKSMKFISPQNTYTRVTALRETKLLPTSKENIGVKSHRTAFMPKDTDILGQKELGMHDQHFGKGISDRYELYEEGKQTEVFTLQQFCSGSVHSSVHCTSHFDNSNLSLDSNKQRDKPSPTEPIVILDPEHTQGKKNQEYIIVDENVKDLMHIPNIHNDSAPSDVFEKHSKFAISSCAISGILRENSLSKPCSENRSLSCKYGGGGAYDDSLTLGMNLQAISEQELSRVDNSASAHSVKLSDKQTVFQGNTTVQCYRASTCAIEHDRAVISGASSTANTETDCVNTFDRKQNVCDSGFHSASVFNIQAVTAGREMVHDHSNTQGCSDNLSTTEIVSSCNQISGILAVRPEGNAPHDLITSVDISKGDKCADHSAAAECGDSQHNADINSCCSTDKTSKSAIITDQTDNVELSTSVGEMLSQNIAQELSWFRKPEILVKDMKPSRDFRFTDLWNRFTVQDVLHHKKKDETHLKLWSRRTETACQCVLKGFWADTTVNKEDVVNVFGELHDNTFIIDDQNGLIIVSPDQLLSGTLVVSSMFCARKSVLNEKFKGLDSGNLQMLYGSIIHSLFQTVLKDDIKTEKGIIHLAQSLLTSNRFLHEMYSQNVQEEGVMDEIRQYIPSLISWLDKHSCTTGGGRLQGSDVVVTEIHDIEENIWSPRFGLKGKIDTTVKVKLGKANSFEEENILPLELKTGKASFSAEHKGQVILYTMMCSDRREDPEKGILLYLKHGEMETVSATPQSKNGLIQLRNQLAHYLARQVCQETSADGTVTYYLGQLPQPINNQRACSKCAHLLNCSIYQRSVEQMVHPDRHSMASLVPETLQHLNESDLTYFVHWNLCLDMEGKESRQKEFSQIWCAVSSDRETEGECLSNLVITSSELGIPESQCFREGKGCSLTFTRHPSFPGPALSTVGLMCNDMVVISSEDGQYIALATGFIRSISHNLVEVVVDRDHLHDTSTYTNVRFRMDRNNNINTYGNLYTNLSRLMEPTPRAGHLRDLIINMQAPEFELKLSKSCIQKVKSLFKPLNKPQRTVILKVLMSKDYVLIKGFPGTGKTSTIVALVKILRLIGQSVLLTSYTHSAVDNILLKLKQDSVPFLRLGRQGRIHPSVVPHSAEILTSSPEINSVQKLKTFYDSYDVVATSCLGVNHPVFSQRKFDVCIVDEASQVLQPACLGPLFCCHRFVLVGDPKQLPPIVQSGEARKLGMGDSLFDRLDTNGATYNLDVQYRMNRVIMELSNKLVYEGQLRCGSQMVAEETIRLSVCDLQDAPSWLRQAVSPDLERSVVFLDTQMIHSPEVADGRGFTNETEAQMVLVLLKSLVKANVTAETMGVISFYRSQVKLIQQKVGNCLEVTGTEVNTVDQYQGRDKSVIIVSCVRSRSDHAGELLKDVRRLNVAMTRARHKLILLGNANALKSYEHLAKIVKWLEETQNIIQVSEL